MIGYFPTPYPDELLYSVLARYHLYTGAKNHIYTTEDLFGKRVKASKLLPSNLNLLVNNLPKNTTLTTEDLINEHTTFPFFRSFLAPEIVQKVKEALLSSNGVSVNALVGLSTSNTSVDPYLNYCPTCFRNENFQYGEAYWHRIHQIPGVYVCPHHGDTLRRNKRILTAENLYRYIPAIKSEISNENIINFPNIFRDELQSISKDVFWLLNSNLIKSKDFYQKKYVSLLQHMDLAYPLGRIKKEELLSLFLEKYPIEFLKLSGLDFTSRDSSPWVINIFRKQRVSPYPLKHILIMRFLCGSTENFYSNNKDVEYFGSGPWYCLSPISDHFMEKTISEVKVVYNQNFKKTEGYFKCHCGFEYSRIDKNEKRYHRVINFGNLYIKKFSDMVRSGCNIEEVRNIFRISPYLFQKFIKEFNVFDSEIKLSLPSDDKSHKSDVFNSKKNKYRNSWLELRKINPYLSKTQLRELEPSTYTWLFRFDKEWLNANSPTKKKNVILKNKRNWSVLDEEILNDVKNVVEDWKEEGKPKRITINGISSQLNKKNIIFKYKDRLPLTYEFLDKVTETVEQFQIRRANWVIREIVVSNQKLSEWLVYKLASLRPDVSELVKREIKKSIKIANSQDCNIKY